MLSKDKRLNISRSFQWVINGQKIEDQLLSLYFRLGDNDQPKVGVAISAKKIKTAVARNKTKRLIMQSLSGLYTKLLKNTNILVMPKIDLAGKDQNNIQKNIELLLQKGRLTND
ncbi:ribonuclease P protein component [Patescibacteria group bacterium]|nr:ribonuclease P protein component [Patescibacteria group bacterium]MCL5410198.1 ribonuclease P protein component [Patescibacteria group bacterium]